MNHSLAFAVSKAPVAISLLDDAGNCRPPALIDAINLARMGQKVQILIVFPLEDRSDVVNGGVAWTKSVIRLASISDGEFAIRVFKKKGAGALVTLAIAPPPPPSPKSLKDKLDESVDTLEISVRAANSLQNGNIRFVGELVQKSDADLLKLKGMGRKDWKLIKEVLFEQELKLGMDTQGWTPPA